MRDLLDDMDAGWKEYCHEQKVALKTMAFMLFLLFEFNEF